MLRRRLPDPFPVFQAVQVTERNPGVPLAESQGGSVKGLRPEGLEMKRSSPSDPLFESQDAIQVPNS